LEYEGAFYHVTARGNERRKIYFSEYDYQKVREYLGTAQDKYGYKLHCYVLMTNHYHILIETPNGNISKVMHYINGAYTNYVNRKIGELIGGISYAAVSKAYHRFDIKLKGDKSLVKVIKQLEDRMSHV